MTKKETNYEDLKIQPINETVYSQSVNLLTVNGGMEWMDFGVGSELNKMNKRTEQKPVCNTGILYLINSNSRTKQPKTIIDLDWTMTQ